MSIEQARETAVFDLTMEKRALLLGVLSDGQGKPIDDPRLMALYLATLKDMDAQTLGRMKIKVDDKAVDKTAGAAAMVAGLLNQLNPNIARVATPVNPGSSPKLPDLSTDLDLVPGETTVGTSPLSLDEFMAASPSEE